MPLLMFAAITCALGWLCIPIHLLIGLPEYVGFAAYLCTALPIIPASILALGVVVYAIECGLRRMAR